MKGFGPLAESNFDRLQALRKAGEPLLDVKIPPHYRILVEREIELLGRIDGPLYSIVAPRSDRFDHSTEGVPNFVDDFGHMPNGLEHIVVHRYPRKLLYFPTQFCIGHCQYCFRPDITALEAKRKREINGVSPKVLQSVQKYLLAHPQVREVIFSGGDPLACSVEDVELALTCFLEVPSVKSIRFHTKAPVFSPSIVTQAWIDLLTKYKIRLVLHIVHPYELCEVTTSVIERLHRAGIALYNQAPLLRGVNDHPAVIMELLYRGAEIGIQPLTFFVADPIRYGESYRIRLDRVYRLVDEVFLRGEAWISNFRVCLDTPIGKVKEAHIVHSDRDSDYYVFERDGQRISYAGIPRQLDKPTPLQDLLYNGASFVDMADWRDMPSFV
ncbi:radical SAM protein [Bradyrhizobium lablabi]|uniref:radical SAM protein n=1 Tax=Bradyrhizobium lablabi TaxID=722472 RepID=UPI001BAB586B|nr:radical SAM protein [Bradyrhizobium lablabi]MBR0696572.1 radical SAM protein [Bradyrhizobium lablabi]